MVGLRKYAAVLSFAFIAAASMLSPKEANAQPIPTAFDARTGHYYLGFGGWTWLDARYRAGTVSWLGRPGHLASIKDSTENDIVSSVVDQLYDIYGCLGTWIGGYDLSDAHNRFEWTTPELFTYTNWAPGEPNNAGGKEVALEMSAYTGGLWNDVPQDATIGNRGPFVGEFEPSQVTLLSITGPTTVNSPKAVNYVVKLAAPAPPGGAILFMHSNIPAIAAVLPRSITIPAGNTTLNVPLIVAQTVAPNQVGYVRVYGKNKKSLTVTVTP